MRYSSRSPFLLIGGLFLVWFVSAFLVYPNLVTLRQIFFPHGSFSTGAFAELWESDRAVASLRNSFLLAVVLSVTVNAVGLFVVLVTRYFAVRGARLLWVGYASTLVYGGVIAVSGYQFAYGPGGLLPFAGKWFTGMPAVVIVMTLTGTGYHLLFVSAALARIDQQTIEAARQLGASTGQVLRRIVLPALKPTLFAVTVLTFLGGLSAFAAPQVLGGRDFETITPMILTFARIPSSRDLAATLALILGAATLILLTVLNRLEAGGTYFSVAKVPVTLRRQPIGNRAAAVVVHGLAYLLFAAYLLPPALVVLFSFTDTATISSGHLTGSSFTLANYAKVLTDAAAAWPFLVSVGYAAVAAAAVLFLMLFVARVLQKVVNAGTVLLEYLLHIPWVLPSTLTALGLIITYSVPRPIVGNVVLTGTVGLLAIAYVTAKIPFTLRILKAAYAGIPDTLEEAAAVLGAGLFRTYRRVLLPIVLPAALAVTALNFNGLLDEYDTAVFLAHPFYQPLGIVIQNAAAGEGTSDAKALTFVYAVLLMLISSVTLWFVHGRRSRSRSRKG